MEMCRYCRNLAEFRVVGAENMVVLCASCVIAALRSGPGEKALAFIRM